MMEAPDPLSGHGCAIYLLAALVLPDAALQLAFWIAGKF